MPPGAAQEYLDTNPGRIDFDPGWEGVEKDLAPKTNVKIIRRWQRLYREGRWSKDGVPPADDSDGDAVEKPPPKKRSHRSKSNTISESSTSSRAKSGSLPSLLESQRTAVHARDETVFGWNLNQLHQASIGSLKMNRMHNFCSFCYVPKNWENSFLLSLQCIAPLGRWRRRTRSSAHWLHSGPVVCLTCVMCASLSATAILWSLVITRALFALPFQTARSLCVRPVWKTSQARN